MTFLVNNLDNAVFEVGKIQKGIFKNVDDRTELYKVTNDKGTLYAVASGYSVKEADVIPEDYHNMFYSDEKGFYYEETDISDEEKKLAAIDAKVEYLAMMLDVEIPEIEV